MVKENIGYRIYIYCIGYRKIYPKGVAGQRKEWAGKGWRKVCKERVWVA
jgi:hypothetical protein